jgi:hypothetical protein
MRQSTANLFICHRVRHGMKDCFLDHRMPDCNLNVRQELTSDLQSGGDRGYVAAEEEHAGRKSGF